ncbi:MAG TPA: GMC oxidoreductase, partial [Nitrospiria bacterium]
FLSLRTRDDTQWRWMIGRDFYALRQLGASSPKFRAPTLSYVFSDFLSENDISTDHFIAVGSLATGGLSNAWGCGVARFDASELTAFPFSPDALEPSYEQVARRIGISGNVNDDLSDYFGLDAWAQAPIDLDAEHLWLSRRYADRKAAVQALGVRIGRSRLAVLSKGQGGRNACNRSGMCLWGCREQALYSASQEVSVLAGRPNVVWRPGVVIEALEAADGLWAVRGHDRLTHQPCRVRARKVLLAAGALASARLVLKALQWQDRPVRLQSNPVAAFLLWLPARLGSVRQQGVALAQMSFTAEGLTDAGTVFGSLFSTFGLPVSEFVRYVPLARRFGIDLLQGLMSSMVVANCFLPGGLSQHQMTLNGKGQLRIEGAFDPAMPGVLKQTERRLRQAFGRLGARLLPGGFVSGSPGSDVHYACTVPMKTEPSPNEAFPDGQVAGLPGVYVVDGSALSSLPAKAHTLTIMANADRIGRIIARRFGGERSHS